MIYNYRKKCNNNKQKNKYGIVEGQECILQTVAISQFLNQKGKTAEICDITLT